MAYNSYQPYQAPNNYATNYPMLNPIGTTGIIWVQGESGAKAYPVTPGSSIPLFDSESDRFFIKTTDASGMPLPLRSFAYSENREDNSVSSIPQGSPIDETKFVTREEFEELVEKINRKSQQPTYKKGERLNGKPLVQ